MTDFINNIAEDISVRINRMRPRNNGPISAVYATNVSGMNPSLKGFKTAEAGNDNDNEHWLSVKKD